MIPMKPLEWINGRLRFLDQTKLPLEELFCETDDAAVVVEAIKRLAIRGAPLIGIAAAYGVALASRTLRSSRATETRAYLLSIFNLLASTRPTAVNLFWALERQRHVLDSWQTDSIADLQKKFLDEAKLIHQEDAQMCESISSLGEELLPHPCSILTHCNAGALATGGRGTAIGIITKAWERGKLKHVYVDETRPLLQGARLTAWEMKQAKIPSTLIIDSVAAVLMQQKKIDAVIVGADRIARNGDTANKVGTYSLAVLAKHHGIPFYVAAPDSSIDFQITTGNDIPIEQRNALEVSEPFGQRTAPDAMNVYSPAFDVTPQEFVTALITNQGVFQKPLNESLIRFFQKRNHAG
jgi:methylthioribose-1-phosphate isomerase